MFHLLYQIFAHIYESHYQQVIDLGEGPHLNALLAHFITFGREFKLFISLDVTPLSALVDRLFPPESATAIQTTNLAVRRLSQDSDEENCKVILGVVA